MHNPAEILTRMHREIGAALHQQVEHTQQDGIDIAMVKIDKSAKEFCFSGAGLHLLHYNSSTQQVIQTKGDKFGLGGLKWHSELAFCAHTIAYDEPNRIYLYTDGIIDQPSAIIPKTKRMGSPAWLGYVTELAELPFEEQQESCNRFITDLLTIHEQRDDITIIGLEL